MSHDQILIIGMEKTVEPELRAHLARAGFASLSANGTHDGIQLFLDQRPAAVIVRDVSPGLDGWDIARRIREMSRVPIVFVSDHRDVFAMERALHVGDDYLTPPWNWTRLTAKLAALLRRQADEVDQALAYDDGRLSIDFAKREVIKDGRVVHLTDTEFKLLSCFVHKPNRVLAYDELLTQVWGHTHYGAKSHVSLYVRYLRKKLEDDPAQPAYFSTEWGVGYSFRPRQRQDPLAASGQALSEPVDPPRVA